jgi:hypothetical protein
MAGDWGRQPQIGMQNVAGLQIFELFLQFAHGFPQLPQICADAQAVVRR